MERAFRFNVARLPATPTRPPRGPWLAMSVANIIDVKTADSDQLI
jgi:hypothetical protein